MKSIIITKHGNYDVLTYTDTQKPTNKKDHVIIKVKYCALNHLDLLVRNGLRGRKVKFPHVLGSDICGILENDFGDFNSGDEVVVYPVIKNTTPTNLPNMIGGFSFYDGGYSEFVRVPKNCIIKKPKWLSSLDACTLNVSYLTVWNILQTLNCKKNDKIFVWGGNSGIGTATILLAKAIGCNVITTISDHDNVDLVKKIGADHVIDRKKENVLKSVRKNTNNIGVDYVIDHVGSKTWPTSINMLKRGGKMATCGITTGTYARVNISRVYNKKINILGFYMGNKSQLINLHKFINLKKIKPIIDSIFDLADVKLAHKKLEQSKHFGKIILRVT
ncbi:MAG: zinc-binding dehydrogenase [Thaumarchaeota archaeon]|nr:zinc-binding dehydrogenase [Nitrososphaerota archaeon]